MITFVLTAFSTITTVLPFLTQSSDNQSPDISRSQALVTLSSPNTQFADRLWADNILHILTYVNDQSNQNKKSSDQVSLTGANTATPTFTAPTVATSLVFSLSVTDSTGAVSSPATVSVTVT